MERGVGRGKEKERWREREKERGRERGKERDWLLQVLVWEMGRGMDLHTDGRGTEAEGSR